jgi:hypothetical protein
MTRPSLAHSKLFLAAIRDYPHVGIDPRCGLDYRRYDCLAMLFGVEVYPWLDTRRARRNESRTVDRVKAEVQVLTTT